MQIILFLSQRGETKTMTTRIVTILLCATIALTAIYSVGTQIQPANSRARIRTTTSPNVVQWFTNTIKGWIVPRYSEIHKKDV